MNKEIEDNNKYDKDMYAEDMLLNTDVDLDPTKYMHLCIVNILNSIKMNDNVQNGMLSYIINVDTFQNVSKSAGILDEEYDRKLEEFKKTDEYVKAENTLKRNMVLAQYKFHLITTAAFEKKEIRQDMKL